MHEAVGNLLTGWFWALFIANEFLAGVVLSIVFFATLSLYFAPTIAAAVRGHHLYWTIYVINLLLGWLLVGWIIGFTLVFLVQPAASTIVSPSPSDPIPDGGGHEPSDDR